MTYPFTNLFGRLAARRWRGKPRWLRPGLVWFAFDLIGPTVLIYLMLWRGSSLYLALLASATVSAASALASWRQGAGNQRLAPYMLAMALATFAVSLVTGSDRFLLARESVLTATVACFFFASLWSERPLTYRFTRPLLERRISRMTRSWEWLWAHEPRFRRLWRVSTVMWSVALLLDAVLRVVMAYSLPVKSVPLLQTALMLVTVLIMQFVTNGYYMAAGLWRMLYEEPAGQPDTRDERNDHA